MERGKPLKLATQTLVGAWDGWNGTPRVEQKS